MKLNKINRKMLIFIITLLVLNVALAADFSVVTAEANLQMQKCQTLTDYLVIKNEKNQQDTFTISIESPLNQYIGLSQTKLNADIYQNNEIAYSIQLPCEIQEGNYNLNIHITDKNGNMKTVRKTVTVREFNNIGLENIKGSNRTQTICSGETHQFNFMLQNTGTFPESYQLSLKNYEDQASLSDNALVLQPGASKAIGIGTFFDAEELGEKKIEVEITALNSGLKTTIPFYLKINGCYGFEIKNLKESYEICKDTSNTIKVTLENTKEKGDIFQIETEGEFGKPTGETVFSKQKLTLSGGESREFSIFIAPDKTGSYPLKIIAQKEGSNQKTITKTDINVKDCSYIDLDAQTNHIRLLTNQEKQANIFLKNKEAEERTFNLNLIAPTFIKLSQDTVDVYASDTTKIAVPISPGENTGSYSVKLTATDTKTGDMQEIEFRVSVFPPEDTLKTNWWYVPLQYLTGGLVIFLLLTIIIGRKAHKSKPKEDQEIGKISKFFIKAYKIIKYTFISIITLALLGGAGYTIYVSRAIILSFVKTYQTELSYLVVFILFLGTVFAMYKKLTSKEFKIRRLEKQAEKKRRKIKEEEERVLNRIEKMKTLPSRKPSIIKIKHVLGTVFLIVSIMFVIWAATAPKINLFESQPDQQDYLIRVDDENLTLRNGNIIITEDTKIPIDVKNKEIAENFNLNTNIDWITIEKKTEQQNPQIMLNLAPPQSVIEKNAYLQLNLTAEEEGKMASQLVNIEVRPSIAPISIVGYVLLGVLLLLVSLVLVYRKEIQNKRYDEALSKYGIQPVEEVSKKETKQVPKKDLDFEIQTKKQSLLDMLNQQKKEKIEGLETTKLRKKDHEKLKNIRYVELGDKID